MAKVKKVVIVTKSCKNCEKFKTCDEGQRRRNFIEIMLNITKPKEVVVLESDKDDLEEKLKEHQLPTIWLQPLNEDGEPEDVSPCVEYYYIFFDDGRIRCALPVREHDDDTLDTTIYSRDEDEDKIDEIHRMYA